MRMNMNNMYFSQLDMLWTIFSKHPNATAYIRGSENYPETKGVAQFYQLPHGVLMVVEMRELPNTTEQCKAVIVHQNIDDFSSQPSGNAGAKIACGEIIPIVLD